MDWIVDYLGCILDVLAMYIWYQPLKEKRCTPEKELLLCIHTEITNLGCES